MLFIIDAQFQGRCMSVGGGLSAAILNAGKLFVWSMIVATVGIALQAERRNKLLGTIIAAILGAAWSILTYFSLPALTVGGAPIMESFYMSAETIRKTWGETIVVNFGVRSG